MSLINCPECGKEVSSTAAACPNCGFGVKEHFDKMEAEKIAAEQQKIKVAKRKQRNKVLKIVIPITVVLVVVISVLIVNNRILSERKTFESETEMSEFLKGYWMDRKEYVYTDDTYELLYIDGKTLERVSNTSTYSYASQIKLHPKRGCFTNGSRKYIINKYGDIVRESGTYTNYYTAPDGFKPFLESLEFSDGGLNVEDSIATCSGSVTNKGNKSYQYVDLQCDFKDKDGNIIASEIVQLSAGDYTSGYNFEIKPGETFTYEALYPGDLSKLESCSVSLLSYSNY